MWIDDQVLQESAKDICLKTFLPKDPVVVLGRSNKRATEANRQACERDGVAILKRLGGGGTVVLHSGCLVVSCGAWVQDFYKNDLYFKQLNQSVINIFQNHIGEHKFSQRGFSDIVLGDKKLVGTSLFRSRNYLLYQASILVEPRIDLMETYLQHPSAEPDYRQGRKHRDFVMGLADLCQYSPGDWLDVFQAELLSEIQREMRSELISADEKQVPHLLSRIAEPRILD